MEKRILSAYALIITACLSISCGSKNIQHERKNFTLEQFQSQYEVQQANYIQNLRVISDDDSSVEILRYALNCKSTLSCQTALKKIYSLNLKIYKKEIKDIINKKDGVTRYLAFKVFSQDSIESDDLNLVVNYLNDREWLVREICVRQMRKYSTEKKEKKYFTKLLLMLNEKNPDVVKELYRTLKWYDESEAFKFLFQRSFHASTEIEQVFILRELAEYKKPIVKNRLNNISRYNKSFIVRQEAKELVNQW